jgi:hypothetical protein
LSGILILHYSLVPHSLIKISVRQKVCISAVTEFVFELIQYARVGLLPWTNARWLNQIPVTAMVGNTLKGIWNDGE